MQEDQSEPRELSPIQFFGNDSSGLMGVERAKDFRPGVSHTFAAEPGEPGVPVEGDDEEPQFEEEPLHLLEDAPPVDEPAADAEGELTDSEVQPAEE